MRFLAYLILNKGEVGDLSSPLPSTEARHLEAQTPDEDADAIIRMFKEKKPPRLFATHMPFRLVKRQVLEDKVKVIVLMRNPKDTLVSFFEFHRMNQQLGSFSGSWHQFFELFKRRPLMGDVIDHCVEWWKVRDLENVMIVRYEEMKKDLDAVVRKVAKFLGCELEDNCLQKIVHLTGFKEMRTNPRVNGVGNQKAGLYDFEKATFLRKGVVGDWVNYFSEEESHYIQTKCDEKCAPHGLTFEWYGKE